jgi:DNA replication protein DnaC
MNFKDTREISLELSNIFKNINSLPQVNCRRCGALYRGEEEFFVCTECIEKENQKREKKKRKNHQIQTLLSFSNIPRRYKDAIFRPKTDIQKQVSRYFIENFTQKNLRKSTDILLFGAIGTGKTYISCAFAKEIIKQSQKRVKYITEYDLLSLYFEKKYQEFRSFRECQILILDEIGKRILADWQRVQLEELLSHRYNEMLPTVYITNLEQSDFRAFLGSRLADRLRENHLERFAFDGGSLRG